MKRTPKNGQLRVRLNSGDHERLVQLAAKRDKGDTVSGVVRDAIESLLASNGQSIELSLGAISDTARERLMAMAKELKRTPVQVLEDCVEGIFDLVEKKAPPLIVMELELRRKYTTQRNSKSQSESCL
jgi:predicted DNA-binding protein